MYRIEESVAIAHRHRAGLVLIGAFLFCVASCSARQKDDSDSLTSRTPSQLAAQDKEDLRNCVLARAERKFARGHSGNLSATLQAVRGTLETPETRQARYRARVQNWNLAWDSESIETVRVRFGSRGLEVAGEAARPTDAGELYHRLLSSDELPELHLRTIHGNEVDGFEFRFVEETVDELLRRAPDLDTVYARAREMGVEPVLRDVCPDEDDSPERLPPEDRGDWERTIRDLPGAWKFSGYETVRSSSSAAGLEALLYTASEQKDFWHVVEVEFHDGETALRLGNFIPDGEYAYRAPNPLPDRIRRIATSNGVEQWAKFDRCPRPLCGLDASDFPETGEAEVKYLVNLIRNIDQLRSQLYDIEATSWANETVRAGIACTDQILDNYREVRRFSLGLEGKLQVVTERPAEATSALEKTLEHCSEHSIVRTNGEVLLREARGQRPASFGTRLAADLQTGDNLEPSVASMDPRWAERDFVDGAEQLRFLIDQRRDVEVSNTLERVRGHMRSLEHQLMSRHAFLDLYTESLLAPPFADVDVSTRTGIELGPEVTYHRLEMEAEASRTATLQFLTLLRDLQRDRLIVLEEIEWNGGAEEESPHMRASLGILSRE